MRDPMEPVTSKELQALNGWPAGTVGYLHDHEIIQTMNILCQQWGYGRIGQIAAALEDLWRHPEKIAEYEQFRDERMKLLEADKVSLERLGDDVPQPMVL